MVVQDLYSHPALAFSTLLDALSFGLEISEQLAHAIWNFFFAFKLFAQDAADRPQRRLPLDLLFFFLRHVE